MLKTPSAPGMRLATPGWSGLLLSKRNFFSRLLSASTLHAYRLQGR